MLLTTEARQCLSISRARCPRFSASFLNPATITCNSFQKASMQARFDACLERKAGSVGERVATAPPTSENRVTERSCRRFYIDVALHRVADVVLGTSHRSTIGRSSPPCYPVLSHCCVADTVPHPRYCCWHGRVVLPRFVLPSLYTTPLPSAR